MAADAKDPDPRARSEVATGREFSAERSSRGADRRFCHFAPRLSGRRINLSVTPLLIGACLGSAVARRWS